VPEPAARLEPVEPRHRDVEHHRVDRGAIVEAFERLGAVARELDLVSLELERAAERFPDRWLVVDDQNSHAAIVRMRPKNFLNVRFTRTRDHPPFEGVTSF
jgi:hypothetical protein